MARGAVEAGIRRVGANPLGAADHEVLLGSHLEIEPHSSIPVENVSLLIDVERRVGTVERDRRWLALAFVIDEVVCSIFSDRSAKGPIESPVLVRQDPLLNEILRVEAGVAETLGEAAGGRIGARLGDRVD